MSTMSRVGRARERSTAGFTGQVTLRRAIVLGAAVMLAPLGIGGIASAAPVHGPAGHQATAVHRSTAHVLGATRSSGAARPARHAAVAVHRSAVSTSRSRIIDHRVQQVKPAITCTDSWKTATSGLWNTATNWSTGAVPTSSSAACITAAGTYTVTVVNSGAAGTLTLGGTSGTQTLIVQGQPSVNSNLTLSTATGSDISANGVFELDSEVSGGIAQLEGGSGVTLTNDGTFETANDGTNVDYIEVNLTNDSGATVSIGSSQTRQDDGTTTVNNGTFSVTASGNLALSSASVLTDSGGTLVDNGTLSLNNSTLNQSGGVESAGTVVLSNSSDLVDSAGGGSFDLVNTDGLSGTIPSGQTVTVVGEPSVNSTAIITANVTNHGTFALDSQVNGGEATLYDNGTVGPTLINDGTFKTVADGTNVDYIEADLTNNGTVTIGSSNTRQDEATTTTNAGTFTVAAGGSLALSGTGVFTDSSGTLVDNGSLTLNNCTFNQSGGVESAGTVTLSNSSALDDSAGAGSFDLINVDTVTGTIPAGQSVTVSGEPSVNSEANMPSNVTNHGTFDLDSQTTGGEAGVYDNGTAGVTFTNDGTFNTVADGANVDYIEINLTNNGTVNIGSSHTVQDHNTTTTNAGTFNIAAVNGSVPAGSLALSGQAVFTDSSGTLVDNGTLTLNNSTFNQSGAVESVGTVALSNSSTLNDSAGGGSFSMVNSDALTGTIPSGQTVTVLGPTSVNSDAILGAGGVTNNGTFVLNTESGGGYADVTGGTMTNNGTFETVSEGTNIDYIEANLTNTSTGTVSIAGAITRQDEATTTSNSGSFTITASGTLALTATAVFTDTAGTLVDNGSMSLNDATFNQSGGVESGGVVALSDSSNLNDSAGGGSFSMINTDALSGTIPSGQTVSVLGQPSVNSDVILNAGGVTNNGTFILNTEASGGYANVTGGTLTNNATFETVAESANIDYIEANVVNSTTGTMSIDAPLSRQDDGTTTTNNGLVSVGDGGSLLLTGGSAFTQNSTGTFSATVDATTGAFGINGGTDKLAGTLAINTVGSPTLANVYDVITGATSVTGTFPTLSFGPHAYVVGYTSTAVTVTVATPFSLTGKTSHLSEDIPDKKIKVATGTAGSQAGAVYTATINWGDGSPTSAGTVTVTGSTFSVKGSHTYTATGTYTITTTVSDQLGTTESITGKAIVALPPAPTVTSVSPLVGVQGKSVTLTVNGTEFTTNSVPTFSNPGISVTSTTWKSTSVLTVKIAISATAAPGAGNVTVTTPGGAGTCTGCFTVDAAPTITGAHPSPVHGTTTTVTVTGTGFQSGLTVSTTITGATLGAPTGVTATSFTIQITVPAGTAPGTYKISVTNPDGGSAKHNITVS
jgi:hypothetical protein